MSFDGRHGILNSPWQSASMPLMIYHKGLMHACRLCGRTLTTLGNLHMYMEGGHMRMGLCVIHKELIEELRQDIAAAFTCLSGLILRNESGREAPHVWTPQFPHALYCSSLACRAVLPACLA